MQNVVLEVLDHKRDSMNGANFERYKFKLIRDKAIYISDGFGQIGTEIKPGDIIENMTVIGKLSKTELCTLYYEAKEWKDKQIIENTSNKIWFPNYLGEHITIDDNTGFIYGVSDSFTYIPGYTWLIEWDKKDMGITTGKRLKEDLGVTGIYLEPKIMPGDEVDIQEYIPSMKGKAILWNIFFDKDSSEFTYRFQYRGEYWKMVEYKTNKMLLARQIKQAPIKKKVEYQKTETQVVKQLDLFAMI